MWTPERSRPYRLRPVRHAQIGSAFARGKAPSTLIVLVTFNGRGNRGPSVQDRGAIKVSTLRVYAETIGCTLKYACSETASASGCCEDTLKSPRFVRHLWLGPSAGQGSQLRNRQGSKREWIAAWQFGHTGRRSLTGSATCSSSLSEMGTS
jgi:hypothetical protein